MNKKNCYVCNKENLSKNEIALNKKLIGRKIVKFYCMDCLANYFEVTLEELTVKAAEFKADGCKLFE